MTPTRTPRSKWYQCNHVAPRGHRCTSTIQVIGPARDDYAALTRVDWEVRSIEALDVRCRRHARKATS